MLLKTGVARYCAFLARTVPSLESISATGTGLTLSLRPLCAPYPSGSGLAVAGPGYSHGLRTFSIVSGSKCPNHMSVRRCSSTSDNVDCSPEDFRPKRAVLMRKVTRYEYEKSQRPNDTEEELRQYLTAKGSDYNGLVQRHKEYQEALAGVKKELVKQGLDLRVVQRLEYGAALCDWADVIFTAGGDGTFLMAASKVKGHSKPVIGINTDPARSEGYLCLPKEDSVNFGPALKKILSGRFRWKWRQRIRLTMSGKHPDESPGDLYASKLYFPEHRFWEHVQEYEQYHHVSDTLSEKPAKVLPVLALNEVFFGESLSARVSFYELSVDGGAVVKQKSSGITVCTGTGSTSWFFNINHIPTQSVREILKIVKSVGQCDIDVNSYLVDTITEQFNNSLKFDPADLRMAYVVRDPIVNAVFHVDKQRGFCQRMSVKSRMWDAWLVVDGGVCFRFNDGAIVNLEMKEEDALRCVELL